jgi:acetyl-CoA carboxylase biotin carboxylase subunit
MLRALAELRVQGIKTTVPIHQEILRHSAFHEGRVDTTFIERVLLG